MYVSLHNHCSFSFLDGSMSPKQAVKRVKELGQTALALTDHGNMHGAIQFYDACIKENVKPIVGLEAYIAPGSRHSKERTKDDPTPYAYHITLLAMNDEGLRNLYKLTSLSYIEGFYNKPRIDLDLLFEYNANIICLSGCYQGKPSQMLKNLRQDDAREYLEILQTIFGDRLYIEIQRIIPEQQLTSLWLIQLATELNLKYVATTDSHYARPEDVDFQEQLVCVAIGKTLQDSDRMGRMVGLHLKSNEEMMELFSDYPNALETSIEITNRIQEYTILKKQGFNLPVFTNSKEEDIELFIKLTKEGMITRGLVGKKEFEKQLAYELDIIIKMGFPSYFLIVSDYVNWAKNAGYTCGPGRGSAAGCLVSFCLGITDVQPLQHGLIFERFLNPGRTDSPPDIDWDISEGGREAVYAYLQKRYGKDRVAQISTLSEFKPRGACRDIARVQGLDITTSDEISRIIPAMVRGRDPTWDECISMVPELTTNLAYKSVIDMARKTEGLVRHRGVHAGGIVISHIPMDECAPRCSKDEVIATQWDKDEIERIGLIKMDVLGVNNLTTINKCLKIVKQTRGLDIDITKIPYDDPKAYELIGKNDIAGIFQFDSGGGIAELGVKLQPQTIDEISAILALYRPGPIDSGLLDTYVKRKNGQEPVEYLFPELKPILGATYGVLVYQEQVMKIAVDLAGYTLAESDDIRKAVGKKIREKMAKHREKMTEGLVKNGVQRSNAERLWQQIEVFADYAFNKTVDKNTKIVTLKGEKRIENCIPGDVVFCIDHTGNIQQTQVVALHDHGQVPLVEVEFDDGTIERCTRDHKWLTKYGQRPLWQIIEMDLSVWGTVSNKEKDGNTSRKLRRVYAKSQSGTIYSKRAYNALRFYGNYDTKICKRTSCHLYSMQTTLSQCSCQKLSNDGTHFRNAGNLFTNSKKDLSAQRYSRSTSGTTCKMARRQSRKNARNYAAGSKFSKKVKGGNLFRTSIDRQGISTQHSNKMRRSTQTGGFYKSNATNCNRNRWSVALFPNYWRRNFSENTTTRSNVRSRDNQTQLEINKIINRTLQKQYRRNQRSHIFKFSFQQDQQFRLDRDIILRKIIRTTPIGFSHGYDLEVKHPSHNFLLASGLCCSNSHSISYAYISYWTAWLKANYTTEFYCALLTQHANDRQKAMVYLSDCKKHEITVLPPDVNESEMEFAVVGNIIRFGLAGIRDVGEKAAAAIVENRKIKNYTDLVDFHARTKDFGINKKTIEALAKAGAFASLNIQRAAILQIAEQLVGLDKEYEKYLKKLATYEKKMIAYNEREVERAEAIANKTKIKQALTLPEKPLEPEPFTMPLVEEMSFDELLRLEKEMLGLYISGHPLYAYQKEIMRQTTAHTASLEDNRADEYVKMLGVVASIKKISTKTKKKMATILLEDLHGTIETTIFPKLFEEIGYKLTEGDVILVDGRVDVIGDDDIKVYKLLASKLQILAQKHMENNSLPSKVYVLLDGLCENYLHSIPKIANVIKMCPGKIELIIRNGDWTISSSNFRISQEGIKQLMQQNIKVVRL